jgi:hypothetical protein
VTTTRPTRPPRRTAAEQDGEPRCAQPHAGVKTAGAVPLSKAMKVWRPRETLRSASVLQKFKTTRKFIPMRMATAVDAIEHVSKIRLSVRNTFNGDRKACFDQIDSRRTHWPENPVVLSQGVSETLLTPTPRIEFTSRTIDRVASVKHGGFKVALLPVINRFAY